MSVKLEAGQWYRTRRGEIVYCIWKKPSPHHYPFMVGTAEGHTYAVTERGMFWANGQQQDGDIIEHLPDCTCFDWVPPKPVAAPDGWRLLTKGERVERNDFWFDGKEWKSLLDGRSIAGESWDDRTHHPVARKIEPKLQLRKGAWYERKDGKIVGPCELTTDDVYPWRVGSFYYRTDGTHSESDFSHLVREVEPPQPKYRPFKDGVEFEPFRDEWFCDSFNASFRVKATAYDSVHVWFAGCNVGQKYAEAFKYRKREDGSPFGVLDAS